MIEIYNSSIKIWLITMISYDILKVETLNA